jgi:uncharacterized protein (UPF0335 family)
MELDRAERLYNHVRSVERLNDEKQSIQEDINERFALAKQDGFDTNVMKAIVKRRKNGEGQTIAFDTLLQEYEDAIEEQKKLQFDDEPGGRRPTAPAPSTPQ